MPSLRPRSWTSNPRRVEALASGAFTLLVAWPYLSLSQYVAGYDTITYSGPVLSYLFGQVRGGHLPQWNDQIFGGVPFMANPQTAALYPPKYLFLFVQPARALDLITAMHLFVLAAGMFVLCAFVLKLKAPAAFVGTVAVVGSGLVMVRSLQFEQIAVVAWIPWVLTGVELCVRPDKLRTRPIAGLGAATALLLLGVHPQQTYMAIPLVVIWTLARAYDSGSAWRDRGRRLTRVLGGGALGALLAAPQLLISASQLGASAGAKGRTLEVPSTLDYIVLPGHLPLALFGDALNAHSPGASGPIETALFVGAAVVLLAAIGLVVAVRRRALRATAIGLLLTVMAGLLLTTGPQCNYYDPTHVGCEKAGWPYRFLFFHLPGFDQARVPARWGVIVVVALAILAAYAVDAMTSRSIDRTAIVAGTAIVLSGVVIAIARGADWSNDGRVTGFAPVVWAVMAVVVVGAAAVVTPTQRDKVLAVATLIPALAIGAELGLPQLRSEPRASMFDESFDRPASSVVTYLRDHPGRVLSTGAQPLDDFPYLIDALRPNTNTLRGVRSLDGYDGGVWVRTNWVQAVDGFTNGGFNNDLPLSLQLQPPPNRAMATRFGVRYLLIDPASTAETHRIEYPYSAAGRAIGRRIAAEGYTGPVATGGNLEVWENPDYRAEGRVSYTTRDVIAADPLWFRALGDLPADESLMVADAPGTRVRCEGDAASCAALPVELTRVRSGTIGAEFDAARPGIFVVPEQNASGWEATVDDRPTAIQTVDAMSIGVPVGAGRHRVQLHYQAPGLRNGLLLSLLGLVGVVVCLRGRWRRQPSPAEIDPVST